MFSVKNHADMVSSLSGLGVLVVLRVRERERACNDARGMHRAGAHEHHEFLYGMYILYVLDVLDVLNVLYDMYDILYA